MQKNLQYLLEYDYKHEYSQLTSPFWRTGVSGCEKIHICEPGWLGASEPPAEGPEGDKYKTQGGLEDWSHLL